MARAISDEELQLKKRARRRLIGAIVLVTGIVVVLPMVLDSEPKPGGQEITVEIPSPESGAFTSRIVPLAEAPAPKPPAKPPAETKPAAPVPDEKKAAPAAAAPAKPVAGTERPRPAPKKEAPRSARKEPAKPAAQPASGRFVVQVIALADAAKARQMQERIAAAGISSYTEVVKTVKGDVTRVRAGPFATREAAEKAREQLKGMGLGGNITTK